MHKASVLKEKLGMARKSNDGGGEDNEPGNDDKAKQGMQEVIQKEIVSMYRSTTKACGEPGGKSPD